MFAHMLREPSMRAFLFIAVAGVSLLVVDAAEACVLRVCPAGCQYSSIQAAIDAAADGNVIAVGKGTYVENLQITDKAITLKGEGPRRTIINVNYNRVVTLQCSSSMPVSIRSVKISGGNTLGGGGGIRNNGCEVNAYDLVVDGNYARSTAPRGGGSSGGGVYNATGIFHLSATVISSNAGSTGGIYNKGKMFIKNVTVTNNSGTSAGGIGNSGTMTIDDATISSNEGQKPCGTCLSGTGGVYNSGSLVLVDSVVSSNFVGGNCGAGIIAFGELAIVGSTIRDNKGPGMRRGGLGGGLCVQEGAKVTARNSAIRANQADRQGGGIYVYAGGALTLIGSNVVRNEAYYRADPTVPGDVVVPGDGGGIFAEAGARITLRNSSVRKNTPNNCVGLSC